MDEPYRLFTSRSEFRLLLRQDNALRRLAPLAERLGLLTDSERQVVEARFRQEERIREVAGATSLSPEKAPAEVGELKNTEWVANLVKRPGTSLRALLLAAGVSEPWTDDAIAAAEIELKYEGYLAREKDAAARLAEMTDFALPMDLPYPELKSLSIEARQKLAAVRPASLAQAGRIPGVSPSDLHNLVVETTRWRRRAPRRAAV